MSKLCSRAVWMAWLSCAAQISSAATNFTTSEPPCSQAAHLKKYNLGRIGVKIEVEGPWATAFRDAMSFWNRVAAMKMHETNSTKGCAVSIVRGNTALLPTLDDEAVAQDLNLPNFQGKIAVRLSLAVTMLPAEMNKVARHEYGHILGLQHNRNPNSLMLAEGFSQHPLLDQQDLSALGKIHRLRRPFSQFAALPPSESSRSVRSLLHLKRGPR